MAHKIGQARSVGLAGDAEARTKIVPEGDPELLTCLEQAEKPVTAIAANVATSATATLSALSRPPRTLGNRENIFPGIQSTLITVSHGRFGH